MSEKKELNIEEQEKIAGGWVTDQAWDFYQRNKDEITRRIKEKCNNDVVEQLRLEAYIFRAVGHTEERYDTKRFKEVLVNEVGISIEGLK